MFVREGDKLDLISFLPVDSHLGHVPACSERPEQRPSQVWPSLKTNVMVAGNESLNGEDLIGGERAEDVGDPQCLRVAVEDNIGPSNSAECYLGLLFISIPVNISAKQEPVRCQFRHAHSPEESDRIGWILFLDNRYD